MSARRANFSRSYYRDSRQRLKKDQNRMTNPSRSITSYLPAADGFLCWAALWLLAAAMVLLRPASAEAQLTELPPPPTTLRDDGAATSSLYDWESLRSGPPARMASAPFVVDDEQHVILDEPPPPTPPGTRDGIFQKLYFTGTWLPAMTEGDLGFSDLETGITLGFPCPVRESPLLVTPSFQTHYLDGPAAPDLPSRVYDAAIQFRWLRKINPRWAIDVGVEPGVHSDFESDDSDAFRVTGHGLAFYDWSPQTKLMLGVVYLNRDDVSLLPAAGIVWVPHDRLRYELVVPRPRIAWRFDSFAGPGCDERWAYVAGEFGGGVWSVERSSGARDLVTARDYRFLLGLERKTAAGLSHHFEVGYVFSRNIEYGSGTPDFQPDDTLLLRLGLRY